MSLNSRPTTIELHKGMSFEARLAGREGSERRVPQEGARRVESSRPPTGPGPAGSGSREEEPARAVGQGILAGCDPGIGLDGQEAACYSEGGAGGPQPGLSPRTNEA